MNDELLNRVAGYLYGDNQTAIDLFKSIYNAESTGFDSTAKEIVDNACNLIPSAVKFNLPFAYTVTNNLLSKVESAIASDRNASKGKENNKTSNSTTNTQNAATKAIEDALEQYGYSIGVDGIARQDELIQEAIEDGQVNLGALLAGKGDATINVQEQIKQIDASTKALQKTLKNVSAIAESLVKGLERIKSEWADTGYDYGRDISKMDASEFSYLADEQTKQLFMLKLAKGELLQESSIDKKGLGDLLIWFDTSGSAFANARDGYRVIDLEMGIALAMCQLATKNKCKSIVSPYHTRCYNESQPLKTKKDINSYFAQILNGNNLVSGGTSFDNALGRIAAILEQKQYPSKRKPGIVFITDGYDSVSQTTQDRINLLKSRQGIKLYSYFVSDSDPRKYSDQLLNISDGGYWINAKKPIEQQLDSFTQLI